jgi:PAS domain S-box-containing protein
MIHHTFLGDGGACGALMRALDWSRSPLGDPSTWPQSLRSVVGLLLTSRFPMFVAWGPELGFLYNEPYAEILGAKHPAAMGARFQDVWVEIWPDILPMIDAVLAGEATFHENLPLVMNRRGFDERTWFTFSYSPVRDQSGAVAGMFCACTETTGQVLAEHALTAERDRAQGVLAGMAEGFTLVDRDFRILDLNAEAMRLETRPKEAIIGRTHWEAYPGSEGSELGRLYKRAMAERVSVSLEHLYRWEDGREAWIEMRAYPVNQGLAVFYRDVSERRAAEDALRATTARAETLAAEQAAILGQLAEGVIVTDPAGRITFVNEAAARIHGVARLDVEPDAYSETYHLLTVDGQPYPSHELPLARAVREGETVLDARWRIQRPDGSEVLAIGSAQPVLDGTGALMGAVLTLRDDTARDEAEAALAASEARLRFLDRLGAETAPLADADAVLTTTTRLLGEHLSASVCAYADMDEDQDGFTIRGDWARPGSRSIVGRYRLADFGKLAVKNLTAGLPLVVNDNLHELAPEEAATFQGIGIAATICMPLVKEGRLAALMAIHDRAPHAWTEAELSLLREVTERSWAHVERVAAVAELRDSESRYRLSLRRWSRAFAPWRWMKTAPEAGRRGASTTAWSRPTWPFTPRRAFPRPSWANGCARPSRPWRSIGTRPTAAWRARASPRASSRARTAWDAGSTSTPSEWVIRARAAWLSCSTTSRRGAKPRCGCASSTTRSRRRSPRARPSATAYGRPRPTSWW